MQSMVTLDVEGVLTPEIWIALADHTGIDAFRQTTKDWPDYDALMAMRIKTLDEHDIALTTICGVIAELAPLDGARAFLDELRSQVPVVLLSDTFEQFAKPLMRQLGWPTLICQSLTVEDDRIVDFASRIEDQKRKAVEAFKAINYRVVAAGDSHNDLSMLNSADAGVLFRAPQAIRDANPQLPACDGYDELLALIHDAL